MQAINVQNPGERKKLIGAAVLGLVAIILLWWAFIGFGSSGSKVSQVPPRPTPTPARQVQQANGQSQDDVMAQIRRVEYDYTPLAVPEPKRNIFVYYVPPPKPVVEVKVPTPTPTPVPPVLLAGLNPSNVFARTGEFNMELTGDKFTSQTKVLIDNSPVQTRYRGAQQLSATVPASLIANPGTRQVMVRSPDGSLYSNVVSFSVTAPPVPNYAYVGILGTTRYIDTAILQDKSSKDLLNAQRGDVLGGRFRVTSISEKEIVMTDTNLKIPHKIAMTSQGDRGNPLQRPPPRVESEDDEP
ncbi:MAG TPA: hypothetical protein VJU86_18525 [Pyrinomonadaceae bacterium]|nr:hypothetical protein [Pyrinomonadaceae bacterium]